MKSTIFKPSHTDYKLSPYTGMTRENWKEAAIYMLTGIFQHIENDEKPVVVPRIETEITYPHNYNGKYAESEIKAEIFEGLTRSFFIAAPLISENPELEICGINIKDYYRKHVLYCCNPSHPYYVGDYDTLKKQSGTTNPFCCFQQTVETCALVICLWLCKEKLWDTYSREEKDIIAGFLGNFAVNPTVPQNWRLFNMLDMAFLKMEGYAINKEIMRDHAEAILDYYAGDGWYRDGQSFDFYSCWAFNFYAPLWCRWYGYENEPYIAKKFEENSNKLMETYSDFFDRDGFTNMWGRSSIYRFASCSPFDGNFFLNNSSADPGEARRISSGALLQFLTRDDFLWNGIPTMGFYRQFSPLVQGYSCAESPFWMGKAFLCLHLPENHPFWTATEKASTWEALKTDEIKSTVLNGPALAFTNHCANGTTILRTGKVLKHKNDRHGMWNYNKLSYCTKYPWESTPVVGGADIDIIFNQSNITPAFSHDEIESQQYVIKSLPNEKINLKNLNVVDRLKHHVTTKKADNDVLLANATFWHGQQNDVLYRRQYFGYDTDVEFHWTQGMFIADFPVPKGLIRVDKVKLHKKPVQLTLGSYGFPDNGTEIETREKGSYKAVILKGTDSQGRPKQLAFTVFSGFSSLGIIKSQATNPDSDKSIIPFAAVSLYNLYDSSEPYVFITQTITSEDNIPFTDEELFAIKEIQYTDDLNTGAFGSVKLLLNSGENKTIDYNGIEGSLSI